ncbi:nodulin-26-like [Apium graveolens]|uniref:nodulin-26-like n=1 Tax=Apium graveolens TaxID=4045 RepID=UPI003D79C9D3
MANTPSTTSSMSPKQYLPTSFSLMEQGKRSRTHKFAAAASSVSVSVSPNYFQMIVAEFIGTYILIFVGCGSALTDRKLSLTIVGIALAWGFSLMGAIYAVGHVSGAHFNPAVTIGLAAARRFPFKLVPMYVLSQLLSGIIACLTLRVLFNYQEDVIPMTTQYSDPTTDLEAIAWEFIITFFLMFVICGAADDDRANKGLAGIAIGVTLGFNVLLAGPITGASMNPARSIGPAIAAGEYKNLWVFVVAPILGATTAALIYNLLRLPAVQNEEESSTRSVYNDLYMQNGV